MSEFATQHTDNMRVAQSRIHVGDADWYVETANGFIVRGGFREREWAEDALNDLRDRVREELAESA